MTSNGKKKIVKMNSAEAEKKLNKRIEEGNALLSLQASSDKDLKSNKGKYKTWDEFNIALLKMIFTDPSTAEDYQYAFLPSITITPSLSEEINDFQSQITEKIRKLESIRAQLELYDNEIQLEDNFKKTFNGQSVFIVHGHDIPLRNEIALFIISLGLKPIILGEQINQGKTLIEKFETHAKEASFAIILLTPDDLGGSVANQTDLYPKYLEMLDFRRFDFFVHAIFKSES